MQKSRNESRIISLLAIIIGIISISIAFTVYSSTLKIKSKANLEPNRDTFNVDFSTVVEEVLEGNVKPVKKSTATYDPNFMAEDAVIVNDSVSKITNISATFTEPGQEVSYIFYAHNIGEYDAYLKSIAFGNVSDEQLTRVCVPLEGATEVSVYESCSAISLSISVGNLFNISESKVDIDSHILDKGAAEKVVVTISYNDGYPEPDGAFEVLFGDITLGYSSVN